MKSKFSLLYLVALLFLFSCSSKDPEPEPDGTVTEKFAKANIIGTWHTTRTNYMLYDSAGKEIQSNPSNKGASLEFSKTEARVYSDSFNVESPYSITRDNNKTSLILSPDIMEGTYEIKSMDAKAMVLEIELLNIRYTTTKGNSHTAAKSVYRQELQKQ